MKAHTRAVVLPPGRLGELHCTPPLTLRRVRSDRADECALCLVGSAAGPLAGDELIGELAVIDGARASLTATGAAIAQGRGAQQAASLDWRVSVGTDASLVADPGPLIVCAGSRVDVTVSLELAASAHLEWHELVVLGRTGETAPGAATVAWDVVRGGRPLLRQHLDLTRGTERTGGHRVLATVLLTGPDVHARTVVSSPTAVAQQLDETSMLLTVLGPDAATVRREVHALRTAAAEPHDNQKGMPGRLTS